MHIIHHDIAYNLRLCLFRKKTISKKKRLPSTVTISDSIPVSSQGTSESDQFPDSTPVSSQGTSAEFKDSIPVSSQGTSINYNSSRFDSCIQPGHICWLHFQTRFLYLARARLKSLKIRFLYPARAHLLTTISGFDSCIQPGHVCE